MDRISLLPDCLLHHILSFLDTIQVVQTCVLSKRWNTVWTHIPTLDFDIDSYPFKCSTINSKSKVRSFKHFVLSVMSKYRGLHVKELRYFAGAMNRDDQKLLVEFLISFAASHMVQELHINTSSSDDSHIDWIRCLSECQSLNVLKICSDFSDEWGALMLPSLRILQIESGSSDDSKYKDKLFSGCPNLERLALYDFICEGRATICAPKLESFEFSCTSDWESNFQEIDLCTPNLRRVMFNNVIPTVKSALDFPSIDEVNIEGYFDSDLLIEYRQNVAQLLRVFHNARSITMPLAATKALLSIPAYVNSNLPFDNLRNLKLEGCYSKICSQFSDEWGALMLPSLRILTIQSACVELDSKYKDKMFSGCPNLEHLVLFDFICEGCATICAPKLERFEYNRHTFDSESNFQEIDLCTPNLRRVIFKNVIPTVKSAFDFPTIEEVNIAGYFENDSLIKYGQKIAQLLRVFHNARSITMPLAATKALFSIPASVNSNLPFDNLRRLKLEACKSSKKITLSKNELQDLLNCPILKSVVVVII